MTLTDGDPALSAPRAGLTMSLPDVEPAFLAGIPPEQVAEARQMLAFRTLGLPVGEWTAPVQLERVLALLVVDGLVLRETVAGPFRGVSLLGPGELADPRELAQGAERWRVIRSGSVLPLDARLLVAGRRWPGLFGVLSRRLFDVARDREALNGLLCLPRVESRLLGLFSHYADRWGSVTAEGRAVDLPVTHEVLGRLVGSKRPTVTLALRALVEDGQVTRDATGRWVLPFAARNPA